jgi:endo-1,4-beta-xylanase
MAFKRAGSLGFVGVCLTAGVFAGCMDGAADAGTGGAPAGSGGTPVGSGGVSSGGLPGSGGAFTTGGSTGTGGAGDGGSLTSGGAPSSGGTAGSGGAPADGGAPGTGGGASGGAPSCPVVTPPTGGNEYCTNTKSNIGNGYGFEIWQEGPGSGCMTVHGQEGTFSAEWDGGDDYDFLARTGLDFNQTQTHQQLGNITAEFAETKTETGDGRTLGSTVGPWTRWSSSTSWTTGER